VTLDNRAGAATLPASSILLADVLVPDSFSGPFVMGTHIRDRRSYPLEGVVPHLFSSSHKTYPFIPVSPIKALGNFTYALGAGSLPVFYYLAYLPTKYVFEYNGIGVGDSGSSTAFAYWYSSSAFISIFTAGGVNTGVKFYRAGSYGWAAVDFYTSIPLDGKVLDAGYYYVASCPRQEASAITVGPGVLFDMGYAVGPNEVGLAASGLPGNLQQGATEGSIYKIGDWGGALVAMSYDL
jgi:hypothetical protein